jgi:S-adenosylmethionine:tRNA ribosyltransferase-isomerase
VSGTYNLRRMDLGFAPDDYDYVLPAEQIAQQPPVDRRAARMLVALEGLRHAGITELPALLAADPRRPLIVLNDSRVVPARVHARRDDGRVFELLICEPAAVEPGAIVRAWVRGAKKLRTGDRLGFASIELTYVDRDDVDTRACRFEVRAGNLLDALDHAGELPLPPYVARPSGPTADDRERYQTVFARDRGSVAAPTAGLHLDAALLAALDHAFVTLHVGPGTFLPMDVEDVRDHRVGPERFVIPEATARSIAAARAEGRAILAVGTTVTRTLESVAAANEGTIVAGAGATELVIGPEHRFRCVDMLLTNFHLPRSSLLMLVCSFAGRERVLASYREAVRAGYRFYSFGDCMLTDRDPR